MKNISFGILILMIVISCTPKYTSSFINYPNADYGWYKEVIKHSERSSVVRLSPNVVTTTTDPCLDHRSFVEYKGDTLWSPKDHWEDAEARWGKYKGMWHFSKCSGSTAGYVKIDGWFKQ